MNFEKPLSLPQYTDNEVKVFHPVLGYCLNKAINNLGLSNKLKIKHHQNIGSLTVDFAVVAPLGRIILLIEIKRTPASVSSTRYRNQARMYVTEAGKLCETPFYVLTNLEITELYRHDSMRSSVIEQIIQPGAINIGSFKSTSSDEFLKRLVEVLTKILNIVRTNKYSYKDQIKRFSSLLGQRKNKQWHEVLVPACFEYIRGSFKNTPSPVQRWRTAMLFKNNPQKLLDLGREINFKNIFKSPKPSSGDIDIWDSILMQELYTSGLSKKSGDDFAELIHLVVGKGREAEGIVTTDNELARFLVSLTRVLLKRDLHPREMVCDPAAGIGSLLTCFADFYPKLEPKQIWANDKERLFEEVLSLRLGLLFPTMLSSTNSPTVTTNCISELTTDQFNKVKVILMNPPFISAARGVYTNEQKQAFSQSVENITGKKSVLNVGQIGLEGPFLELITALVGVGTLIAVIIPKRYLTAQGDEAVALREFLINQFGLRILATYPREGLFEGVRKGTMIVVGIKGEKYNTIRSISADVSIDQIDLQELVKNLSVHETEDNLEPAFGVLQRTFDRKQLQQSVQKGWRAFFGVGKSAQGWIDYNFKELLPLKNTKIRIKRGRLGNKGLSDLLYISSNKKLWKACKERIPRAWLSIGIKNSDQAQNPFLKKNEDFYYFLKVPGQANREMLKDLIESHSLLGNVEGKKQKKKRKKLEEILKILNESSSLISKPGTILIPRGIRRMASGFLLRRHAYVSTNFFEAHPTNEEEGLLLLSWVLSIFGQLQFELSAQDQEGGRKIEKEQTENMKIPDFSKIAAPLKKSLIKELHATQFLDLYNVQLRPIDFLWSRALFKDFGKEKLSQAKDLIEELILERDPQ